MSNVSICTPTTGVVKATYCASLLGMITHHLNNPVLGMEDESRNINYNLLIGSNISQQRDSMVQDSLSIATTTHVLFIDDDMGFEADCLNIALSRKVPIVLANYRRKAPPWPFTARILDAEAKKAVEVVTDETTHGLQQITFGGFGFCLIEASVLRGLKQPRFLNQWVEHQQLYTTEDYPFFKSIGESGTPVYVDHDLSKRIYHVGDYPYQYAFAPSGPKMRKPFTAYDSAVTQEFTPVKVA